jgi:hypothetical protein
MILREKISGKVESGLHYVLLLHDSGIYPVFLTISHEDLFHVEGYFLMMTACRFVYPALFFPFVFGFPAFLGLPLPLPGISALILGFTMAFKRIARFFAWL